MVQLRGIATHDNFDTLYIHIMHEFQVSNS